MDSFTLPSLWFALLGAVWILYLVLGGTDLGVGQVLRHVDRDRALRAIGPTWAANDVWLVLAVAIMLGAFPGWYAEFMAGAYAPLIVLVGAVMARHAAIELIGHATEAAQRRWAWTITTTSSAIPFTWGVIWAGALTGDLAEASAAGLSLLTPVGVLTGLTLVLLCRAQGVAFLRIRLADAQLDRRLRRSTMAAAGALAATTAGLTVAAAPGLAPGETGGTFLALAVVGGVVALLAAYGRPAPARALAGVAVMTAGAVGALLAALHDTPIAGEGPRSVALSEAASGTTTLSAMLILTAVLLPVLLGALAYAYLRFLRAPEGTDRGGPRGLLARAVRGTLDELR